MSRSPPLSSSSLIADPSFPRVKEFVIAQTGLAYYADKDADLARCLAPHLEARRLDDCAAYLALLGDAADGAAELDDLIKDLTIGETFFFRHTELFDALRTRVLPDLIARNRAQRRLRIWSAGCATGAEPYSLAILLRRDLADAVAGWDVTIAGTDINREFLARAGEGVFEEWALRSTPTEVRRDCFTPLGRGWALRQQFKESVSFQYHNLVTHPFPSLINNLFAFDLILCRNVMIYFSQEITRRVLDGFHQSLVDGGWLLVGHAEPSVPLFRAFQTVNAAVGAVLYQKALPGAAVAARGEEWLPPPAFPALPVVAAPTIARLAPATMRAEPPEPSADLTRVRVLADRGEWEPALEVCGRLLATERLNPLLHFYQGLILEQIGRHEEAELAQRRAIYLDRRFALGHYYLGLLLQKSHRPEQAALSFNNVLNLLDRLDPGHVFSDGDGITASELVQLTRMHLAVLEGA